MMRIRCFSCGKSVTNEIPHDVVFRAVAECPECVSAKKNTDDAQELLLRSIILLGIMGDQVRKMFNAGVERWLADDTKLSFYEWIGLTGEEYNGWVTLKMFEFLPASSRSLLKKIMDFVPGQEKQVREKVTGG